MSHLGFAASPRRPLLLAPLLILGLSLLSCGREITGPEGGMRQAAFALAPTFPAAFAVEGAGDVVPFTKVRITLDQLDETRVLTLVEDFPADQQSMELDLTVDLPFGTGSAGIDLILNMQYVNAAGDTVFRAGPQTVTATPSEDGEPAPTVPVEVQYVGTGSNAEFMDMLPVGGTVVSGTTTQFTARAYDATESEIPNTPFVFSSPDATRVTITPQGLATWQPVRGTARIIATLPTGDLADTTTFTVALPATQLVVVSGNGQSAEAGSELEVPVVLRVAAADAVPVAGVTVTFAVATGGGTLEPVSAVSDANGLVSFEWTLGAPIGAQTTTATFVGLATPVTLTATAGQSPAADLQYVAGDEQTGAPGQPLAAPIVVRAVDALGNGVPGVTVDFSVNLGGGSMLPTSVVTDGNGVASTTWTLGSSPGAQGAQAEVDGLQTVIGFTATAAGGAGGAVLWTGAVSNDWSVAGNWSTGAVPTLTDSAVIPAVATQPVLTATTTLVGAVEIQAGTLFMDGHAMVVARDFATTGSGVLVMQDENDVLTVGGDAVFAGGDESGLLSAGALSVVGDFTQTGANSPASFQAGPEHTTVLQGLDPVLTFTNPGPLAANSRFGNLIWSGSGTLTLQNGVSVSGHYATASATPVTHLGIGGAQGRYLEFGTILAGGPLVFDNVRVLITQQPGAGTAVAMNNATFRNLPGTAAQLIVNHPGGSPVTLDNVTFETTPTTGVYISATDNAPTDQQPLLVSVANPTPTTPGAFTSVGGGATISWPAGSVRAWIGVTSTAWTEPSNWSPAAVPGPLDDVTILAAVPSAPVLTTAATISDLTVMGGATLTLPAGGNLTVNGNILSDGNILVDELNSVLRANGLGRSVHGNMENLAVSGGYTLSNALNVSNAIIITGSLNVGGWSLSTADMVMNSGGVLVMQNAEDVVTVTGQVMFSGGSTLGLLTDGVLRVGGRLVANANGSGNPPNSFAPSGDHQVQLFGAGTVDIDIVNGGNGTNTSHFANLDLSQLTGTANLARFTGTYVTGQLISRPPGAPPTLGSTVDGWLNVGGVSVAGLVVDDVTVTVFEGVLDQFDNVTFINFPAAEEPFAIHNPGSATPFTMNGVVWTTTPSGTGARYMQANDTDGPTPNALVINVNNATPASPGGLIAASNGAVLNWPGASPIRVWTGAVSSAWDLTGNWAGNVVPGVSDSARIAAAATTDPVLNVNASLAGLEIEAGATLDLGTSVLTMTGYVHAPATPSLLASGAAQLMLDAPGSANMQGTLPGTQINGGTWTPTTPTVFGGLVIAGGSLSVGADAVTINGSLTTAGTGTLAMSGPANMVVTGDATFSGGNTEGLLTGGTLMVAGDFTQNGSEARSFSAGPGHTVELTGNITQSVSFTAPDLALNTACAASCFGTLRSLRGDGTGDVAFTMSVKAVTTIEIDAENILAGTNTILSGGTPTLTGDVIQAGAIGFVSGLAQTSTTFAVDSLIGFGNGFTLPLNLATPTRLAGSYLIDGPHNAGLVVTQGALEVDGKGTINGDLVTNANGWLRMQQAPDTLTVNGSVTLGGNSPISQLTNGVLNVSASFAQSGVGASSFNPEPAHKTRITGPGATVQFANASGNRFGSLEFATSGAQILTSANVTGDVVVRSTGGPITGTIGQVVSITGGLYDTLGGAWQVPTTAFVGAQAVLPATLATNVELLSVKTLPQDMTFNGNLTIGAGGDLDLDGNRVSVVGLFTTVNGGMLRMTTAADTLSLSGPASFAGGSTAATLTAGVLEIHGPSFQQSATANAFAPSGTHQTWFRGASNTTVTFATPGAGASHFNDLGVSMASEGVSVALLTDAYADGRLMTEAGPSRRISAVARRVLHSRGADIQSNIEFDNVGWALVDGAAAAPINGVRFVNMDPAQTQFSIQRSSGPLAIITPEFLTTPTGGASYLSVSDPDGVANGALQVQVTSPLPAFHGGLISVAAPATVTGWPMPEFRWTGANGNTWTDPGNWSDNVVPGPTDSVHITDGFANEPQFPGQVTLRALVHDATALTNLSSELTITGRLVMGAGMACDGGEITLEGASVLFSGTISCSNVRVLSGTAVADGRVEVSGDLYVWGTAVLQLNKNTVVAPFFSTIQGGQLRMIEPTDSLITQAATFGGGSTNGLLTNGVLVVTGNFTQDAENSAESFAASGNHTTVFAGLGSNQQSYFATPGEGAGTSHFANVEMSKGEPGTSVVLNSRAFALGTLRTGTDAPAQRFMANLTEPTSESVLFQSHGGDVDDISFSNVKWSILDGAPIGRMDNISFIATDSASTRLNIERAADDITIRNIDFGFPPQEGLYLRLNDTNGGGVGLFRVTIDTVNPAFHNTRVQILNGAQLVGWIAG